jgi:integrase
MASLQKKGESWYCQFMHERRRHTFTIGKVAEAEAQTTAARIDYILMRVRQQLLEVPDEMDILTFIKHDGKPPAVAPRGVVNTTFATLRERYLATFGHGALESNTLYTAKTHLNHLGATLGDNYPIDKVRHADLQRHIDKRQQEVVGVTIKKEIDTFRAAWNWACRIGLAQGTFPSAGLVYPKGDDKLPFMSANEIERRIKAGGDVDALWECLYLNQSEVEQLLDHVKERQIAPWIYPAFVMVAHTGARRSEMMRAKPEDVDLAGGAITIREKKRVKGRRTTRRVPMSGRLKEALTILTTERGETMFLFGAGSRMLAPQTTQKAFHRAVKGCKWNIRGWHVLRHSFISALASNGVDQRIIDDFVGHQTEEQRRRYRHLYPSKQQEAIRSVFG